MAMSFHTLDWVNPCIEPMSREQFVNCVNRIGVGSRFVIQHQWLWNQLRARWPWTLKQDIGQWDNETMDETNNTVQEQWNVQFLQIYNLNLYVAIIYIYIYIYIEKKVHRLTDNRTLHHCVVTMWKWQVYLHHVECERSQSVGDPDSPGRPQPPPI